MGRLVSAAQRRAFALWSLGFRPFYLLAAIFASLSIALWGAQAAGWLTTPYLRGPLWHAHEMIFGFTLAVMTGFLFTAVRNWTSRPTPTGASLAALALLWVAGRVLVLTPFDVAAACANVAFPLAVAVGIGKALVRQRQPAQLLLRRSACDHGRRGGRNPRSATCTSRRCPPGSDSALRWT